MRAAQRVITHAQLSAVVRNNIRELPCGFVVHRDLFSTLKVLCGTMIYFPHADFEPGSPAGPSCLYKY